MPKYFIATVAPNGFTVDKKGSHRLKLSVCLDLDIVNLAVGDDESVAAYKNRFDLFYEDFDNLVNLFKIKDLTIVANSGPVKFKDSEIHFTATDPELEKLRVQLWQRIFAKEKINSKGLKITRDVDGQSGIKNLINFSGKIRSITEHLSYLNKASSDGPTMSDFFSKARKASLANKTVAKNERLNFDTQIHIKLGDKSHFPADFNQIRSSTSFARARELNLADYLDLNIDPDEFINTFNMINKNVVLKRLMGFIIDIEVDISAYLPPAAGITAFKIRAGFSEETKIVSLTSNLWRNNIGSKTAYLLEQKGDYYAVTMLRARNNITEYVDLITYDRVAQDDKLREYYRKKSRSESIKQDSFTRGIIFNHSELNKLIEPENYTRDAHGDVDDKMPVNDALFIHGYRVAVKRTDVGKFSSLTTRSVRIFTGDPNRPQYSASLSEGCIHCDSVMHGMEQDGKINGYTSDTLFEWNAQPLTLKSAFSRASTLSRIDKAYYEINNPDDIGVLKSKIATEKHLLVEYYPHPLDDRDPNKVKVFYGLPGKQIGVVVNKLRFGFIYQFAVNAEYKNGWGLPLDKDPANPLQLTVNDLLLNPAYNFCLTKPVLFTPLENKQPPQIFPIREIKKDDYANPENDTENLIPVTDKESLKHLVIRSYSAGDTSQVPVERHILPERISLEHAFWHNLLNQMLDHEAVSWKYRYNCPYHTYDDYNKFVNAIDQRGNLKGKTCPEECKRYCGGTQMPAYSPQQFIYPTYLSDPVIKGFKLKLFWNEACTPDMEVSLTDQQMLFGGTPGNSPSSFRIKTAGTVQEPNIHVTELLQFRTLNIYLKKGINIYAQLINLLDDNGLKYVQSKWYDARDQSFKNLHKIAKKAVINDGPHNPPLKLQLTHAVKTPLFDPEIVSLFSAPSKAYRVRHLSPLLADPAYNAYKTGLNIVAERAADKDHNFAPGGTFARIGFNSKFERLDATSIGKPFVKEVTPTGGLELWMRKEEYIDDPQQQVTERRAGSGNWDHHPELPVESFTSQINHFSQEHNIEFDNDIMIQLKKPLNATNTGQPYDKDLFRVFTSMLALAYDIKTTKFEEREYYLRDLSKYSGYFIESSSAEAPADKEVYALPKREMVERTPSMRYKVMVLNNQPPKKPEIAFAVTTKKETITRGLHDYYDYKQEGNVVTIYLKRGRLTSGKNERIGLPVNHAKSLYNPVFTELGMISKAGRDIVSDGFSNAAVLLDASNIIIPVPEENDYDARFDVELGMFHYLPKFDTARQLWKFDVTFKIVTKEKQHQMHNPFINIVLVHYQPFSVNYNNKGLATTLADLDTDCRLSRPDGGTWCYLIPERNLNVFFSKPWNVLGKGSVKLKVTFDYESLHHFQHQKDEIIRSNFIVAVEGTTDNIVWDAIESLNAHNQIKLIHPLLPDAIPEEGIAEATVDLTFEKEAFIQIQAGGEKRKFDFTNFRIRFTEVEWFTEQQWKEMNIDEQTDYLDNQILRVRYIELMY